jgi:T5SS/PEP-CTERM-associated repeat protein
MSSAAGGTAQYQNVEVGSSTGSIGDLTVDGANTTLASTVVTIGVNGEGDSTISNGGSLVPENPLLANEIFLGRGNGSVGTLKVTGAGSSVSGNWQKIVVGGDTLSDTNGQGALLIGQGGSVSVRDLDIAAGATGANGSATGVVFLSGAGSMLDVTQSLVVGSRASGDLVAEQQSSLTAGTISVGLLGHASVIIRSGAQLTTDGASISGIGLSASVSQPSEMTIEGAGSQWSADSQIQVGIFGAGHLYIDSGGTVTSEKAISPTNLSGVVAVQTGSTGAVTIAGTGSNWTQDGGMSVGHRGEGTLDINSGGVLDSQDGFVGRLATGHGEATIDGADSAWNLSRSMFIGGTETAVGGTGELILKNQGIATIDDTLKIWSGGKVDVSGGGVVNVGAGSPPAAGTVRVGAGGTLAGDGTVVGSVHNDSGLVSPGASPGVLLIQGDYQQLSDGLLQIELGGTVPGAQHDRLDVQGTLTLGGALTVASIDDFSPALGDWFDILDWATLSGAFSTVTLPPLDKGLAWNISQLYSSGVLTVELSGDFNRDGNTDAADYVVWRKIDNSAPAYDAWRMHFSEPPMSSAVHGGSQVPEPDLLILLPFLILATAFRPKFASRPSCR